MKKNFILIFGFTVAISHAQINARNTSPEYDSALAKKLGADKYGMKHYVMAFLKSGPNRITDSLKRIEIQKAHLKNIFRLADEGKLIIAGPFLDEQPVEGIFILNTETIDDAKILVNSDPAIQGGILVAELRPWYGSAALMEINAIHKRIQKKSVADF